MSTPKSRDSDRFWSGCCLFLITCRVVFLCVVFKNGTCSRNCSEFFSSFYLPEKDKLLKEDHYFILFYRSTDQFDCHCSPRNICIMWVGIGSLL